MKFMKKIAIGMTAAIASTLVMPSTPAMAEGHSGSARVVRPDAWHGCDPGWLCVHIHVVSNGTWHWAKYYTCGYYDVPKGHVATWYVNNQTKGTPATFLYPQHKSVFADPAPSRGRIPTHGATALDVNRIQPC